MNLTVANRPMLSELVGQKPFQIGNATVDPVSRNGRWPGGEERLQPLTLKVLLVLRSRHGEVVTRDELTQLCWDGRIVGDDVINRSVSLLRQFAEHAGGFEIETVPRAGYRLVEHSAIRRVTPRRWMIGAAALAAVVAGVGYFAAHQRTVSRGPAVTVALHSLAVPSGDSTSADLAARTNSALARMLAESGISVIDSSTNPRPDQADFILRGSLGPIENGHAATVQLEEPVHHTIVMTRQIATTSSDPESLPDQIGAQISAALSTAAPLIGVDKAYSTDPVLLANLLNKNASSFAAQTNFEIARRTAVSAPDSIMAQLALAMRTGMIIGGTPRIERAATLNAGREAASRLLRLAPQFGDSYLPWCFLHAEARIEECEAQLEKGLATDPKAQSVGIALGKLLLNADRIDEAVPLARTTLAKNPYSPTQISRLLLALDADGQTSEAETEFNRGREFWPETPGLFYNRTSGMLARGDFDALSKIDLSIRASGIAPDYASTAGQLDRAIHEHSQSLARASCRNLPDGNDLPIIECMLASAKLGDLDQSFQFAQRLYPRRVARSPAEEDSLWLANPDDEDTLYLVGSGAAPMRRDPRFLELANRVGLIRYWRQRALPDFCTRDHEPVCRKIVQR